MEQGSGTLMFIVFLATFMILSGILGGILAGLKNRDYSYWIAWSFLLPPSLIVLALLPTIKGHRPRRMTLDEEDAREGD
ncbi:MAG: hypothetical protein ACR2PI_16240 [Hyphomicrobiaceae bacterium]